MIGEALKAARAERGLTQAELAEMIGVSRELIRDIELGILSGASQVEAIASALGLDPTQLDPDYIPGGRGQFTLDPRMPQVRGM